MESNGEAQLKVHQGISRFDDAFMETYFFRNQYIFFEGLTFLQVMISASILILQRRCSLREKQQCFMVIRHFMQEFQEQMDAEFNSYTVFFHRFRMKLFIKYDPFSEYCI